MVKEMLVFSKDGTAFCAYYNVYEIARDLNCSVNDVYDALNFGKTIDGHCIQYDDNNNF